MRPLAYLAARSIVNGIKRSLKSARRLISLIAIVLWYLFVFVRPFGQGPHEFSPDVANSFNAPSSSIVEAFVFAMFAMLSLLLMMGVFSYRGNFRPADIDVLFATPVSPRLVLLFRIFRDYVFTLLLPLLLVIFFYRPTSAGLAAFISKNPAIAAYATKASIIAWILMALFWVCAGYCLSLWANRSDLRSERNRKVLGWAVAGLIIAVVGFIVQHIRSMQSPNDLLTLTQEPFLRAVFFTSTVATQMVMGTITGSLSTTFAAAGLLIAAIALSLVGSFRQVQWMYDQAASRGTDAQTLRSLQRQGDMIGMMAERARSGKLRVKRVTWFHRLRLRGLSAVVWKEMIILSRSSTAQFALLVPVAFAMVVLPVFGLRDAGPRAVQALGPIFLTMSGFSVFTLAMSLSQTGFIEMLRRVDLQKPLPFGPAQIVSAEVAAKVVPTTLVNWAASLAVLIVDPNLWREVIAALIAIPFCGALVCGVVLLMTVLFPDVDDPAQRSLRGLLMMLGLAVAGAPCAGLYVLVASLSSPIPASIVASALSAGIFAGVATIAGNLYASFNPSE